MRKLVFPALSATFVLGAVGQPVPARASQFAEVASALSIAKSNNKNEVHYAVQVDEGCAPSGATPVHPYWRMFERSPDATEPLQGREERAFGIARQDIGGDAVRVVLRGLPERPITIRTWRAQDGRCTSTASTTIAGATARIANVFVKMKLFGVDYVELTGVVDSGGTVRERLSI